MVYLLKMMIFYSYVSHYQRVYYKHILYQATISWECNRLSMGIVH